MGNVKDRYFKYIEAGDQYVGRCLTLTPVLSVALAASPPFFVVDVVDSPVDCWIRDLCSFEFPLMSRIDGFGRLTRMCLASFLYHRRWIVEKLHPNHVVIVASYVFRTADVINEVNNNNHINVTYPWNDNDHVFSGVPPHAALLQELRSIRADQLNLIQSF